VELAFRLKELDVDVIPINVLNPHPGTPLSGVARLHPLDIIKTVAVFRFIHPRKVIKLAGGREVNLGDEWQPLALQAGANGMIIGGYLTTGGDPPEKDLEMMEKAGYFVPNRQYAINKLQTINSDDSL
jgi:biotin synthase